MTVPRIYWLPALAFALVGSSLLWGEERRAASPKFDDGAYRGVFFDDVPAALRSARPPVAELGSMRSAASTARSAPAETDDRASASAGSGWSELISALSIEDEVKRLKLEFDGLISTPGRFKSGGYAQARTKLSVMAALFAIIVEHDERVRWKDEAAAARDLIARTAFNSKSGSVQVYNEAKLRQQDLQDLVSGAGFAAREAEPENEWPLIVDRAPLMEYLDEALYERLSPDSADDDAVSENADSLRRRAEMVAAIGRILIQDEMVDADDPDYVTLAEAMTRAAVEVRAALDRDDPDAVRSAVSAVSQSCDACHEQYR